MNPLFNMFGNSQVGGPFNNINEVINQYNQFKSNFHGDPKQQVQNLLNSGQMSQEQFNQLSNMAQTFQTLLGRH